MNSEFPVRPVLTRNLVTLLVNLRIAFQLFDNVHDNYFAVTHDHRKGGTDEGVTANKLLRKFGLHKAYRALAEFEALAVRIEKMILASTDIVEDEVDLAWKARVGSILGELLTTHDMKYVLEGILPQSIHDILSSDAKQRLQDILLYGPPKDDDDTDTSPL